MLYTKDEVLSYMAEEDVKFIRLAFCDVFGVPKNISIMPSELERAFAQGVSFDASAICGFGDETRSDLFLFPDPATLSLLTWRPSHGRVVRMFCDIRHPDGTPFELDTRSFLKRTVEKAAKAGILSSIGSEFEFYLFKTDDTGAPTRIPFDNAGYMDIAPEDAGENIRREICLTLEEMGLRPECSHHEEGPGQNEIDFRYSDPLSAADHAITFKTVVKTVAARNGLFASFDPKPLAGKSGSGMHMNISPSSLASEDCFYPFMAGILAHIRELTLFFNPSHASYSRLGGYKAPKYITWSPENRSQLIRIPAAEHRRIELRSPDASANPYLVNALLLLAGLDGIAKQMMPPPPTDVNLYTAPSEFLSALQTLPESLTDAVHVACESCFVHEILPERLIEAYGSLQH